MKAPPDVVHAPHFQTSTAAASPVEKLPAQSYAVPTIAALPQISIPTSASYHHQLVRKQETDTERDKDREREEPPVVTEEEPSLSLESVAVAIFQSSSSAVA